MTDDVWNGYTEDERIQIILDLSSIIEEYVNDRSYTDTQLGCYNSQVKKEEFAVTFKQEIVSRSILFISKKKYGMHVVNKEHVPCDEISVTGMEIIKSDTPKAFRVALRELLEIILKGGDKIEIMSVYNKHKELAKISPVEDISENKGVKEIQKFLVNGKPVKGTPYHVKAIISYHDLLNHLDLQDKYVEITEDSKNKLVCVKNNPWGIKRVMYDEWPKEFEDNGIYPDVGQMIEKYYTKKLVMLLEPMKMSHIVNENQTFNLFFA